MTGIKNHSKSFILKHRDMLACLLLVISVFAVYMPALNSAYVWDDFAHVTHNQHLRSLSGLKKIWFEVGATDQYFPLVHTVFWLEYHLWELNPLGYHLVNVLLHAANFLLLWAVLRRLQVSGSLFIAAVFALHPVQVESVAWISEHKNTVSGLFYIASILVYLRFSMMGVTAAEQGFSSGTDIFMSRSDRRLWKLYLLSLLLYICALLSKTVTCTLPAVLLLLLWWKRRRLSPDDFLLLVPFFLLSVVFGLNTIWVEIHFGSPLGQEWTMSFIDRTLVAGRALWFYAGKLLCPQQLTFFYPKWVINSAVWWQYLFPLAAVIVFITLGLLRRRLGRAPLVAVLFYAGTLFPVLGFFKLYTHRYTFVADHYQYLASIGLIALGISAAMKFFPKSDTGKILYGSAFGLTVLAALGLLTWKQAHIYKNQETLYRDIIAKNRQCWLAHNNLGVALINQGRIDEAIGHYLEALRLKSDFEQIHYNLGFALFQKGNTKKAIDHYLTALRLKPDYAAVHSNLGVALQKEGRTDQAIGHFIEALRVQPDAGVYNNLGFALFLKGETEKAVNHYLKALYIKPDYAAAHYNLGIALEKTGRLDEAVRHYLETLNIQPDYAAAHNNLGIILEKKGRVDEAVSHYIKALRINPDFEKAHNNLGIALFLKGDIKGAAYHFKAALRLNPDNVNAKNNLNNVLTYNSRTEPSEPKTDKKAGL